MRPLLLYSVLIAVALFFVGRWTAPDNSKELARKYELERKTLKEQVQAKEAKIIDLAKAGKAIEEKMYEDSVKFSEALAVNKEAYLKLKRKYNEINLNRADAQLLDSLISRLYPD